MPFTSLLPERKSKFMLSEGMRKRQENHEKVAHTIVKESGERSFWKFFINWKTLEKKLMTL